MGTPNEPPKVTDAQLYTGHGKVLAQRLYVSLHHDPSRMATRDETRKLAYAAIDRAVGAGPSEAAKQQCAAAFADAWHADWGGADRVPATTWEAIETLYRYLVGSPRVITAAEAE